jgi:NitT/TauT family transport system permease protein
MLPGSSSGIGYLLIYASEQSDMHIVIACMIIIGGIGAALNALLRCCMGRLVRWHGKET